MRRTRAVSCRGAWLSTARPRAHRLALAVLDASQSHTLPCVLPACACDQTLRKGGAFLKASRKPVLRRQAMGEGPRRCYSTLEDAA